MRNRKSGGHLRGPGRGVLGHEEGFRGEGVTLEVELLTLLLEKEGVSSRTPRQEGRRRGRRWLRRRLRGEGRIRWRWIFVFQVGSEVTTRWDFV